MSIIWEMYMAAAREDHKPARIYLNELMIKYYTILGTFNAPLYEILPIYHIIFSMTKI